jgi:hypothetical protein
MRIHLITAESSASRRLRHGRLIQFPQLTMPLIAALTPREHHVWHTDEIVVGYMLAGLSNAAPLWDPAESRPRVPAPT